MNQKQDLEISETTYQWCVRAFSFLYKHLEVNIAVHDSDDRIANGQIFLFNHFARFEAVIPQYLIYRETGVYCRSVAASELFTGNETLSKLLRAVGAVPNDLPGLLPYLAAEILRGRKVVVFPEGGMVKDRRVIDENGQYSVFSSSAHQRRKHHKGAAALAIMLELFKKRILTVHEAGETARIERWVRAVGLESAEALLAAARRPTLIVPSNITFYPIRTDDNMLRKAAKLFGGDLAGRVREELLIEGNLLLKPTDMDIRFGTPMAPGIAWYWWELALLKRIFARVNSLEDLFGLNRISDSWIEHLVTRGLVHKTRRLRDQCMREMYRRVTVNLSHLAARLILRLHDRGQGEITRARFHHTLYLAIKSDQTEPDIYLHHSLTDPTAYGGIHEGACPSFAEFLEAAVSSELVEMTETHYRFLPKLRAELSFHEVRLENMVAVYANEVAPIGPACRAVDRAMDAGAELDPAALSRLLFDDELRAHALAKRAYAKPQYVEINAQQTATRSGEPYLLEPEETRETNGANTLGIVLVHGFLASPAELRELGEKLAARGHPVIGVRLAGHGTSPWDLRDRTWQDWLESVRRGYQIMKGLTERVCLIWFSTGGSLALCLAAERPDGLAGVVAISAPVRFRNRNLIFVPVIHGANRLTRWASSLEGVMPFRENESEHPDINYRHIPIRGLFELRRLVAELARRLGDIACPIAVIQGSDDRVVDPRSARMIVNKVKSAEKSLHIVPSDRHGIVTENIGDTHAIILDFAAALADGATRPAPPEPAAEGERDARAAL